MEYSKDLFNKSLHSTGRSKDDSTSDAWRTYEKQRCTKPHRIMFNKLIIFKHKGIKQIVKTDQSKQTNH